MEKQRFNSAGLLYFYLKGQKYEDEKVSIEVVDSYKCLPDFFYKKIAEYTADSTENKDVTHIFGIIGINNKINRIKKAIAGCIKENFQRLQQGKKSSKRCSGLDEQGNLFNQIVQEFFCDKLLIQPRFEQIQMEEMSLLYINGMDGKESDNDNLTQATIEIWLEKETPALLGKQVMIRSFYMQNFVGRKLLSSTPFGFSDSWNLLFEGGRNLMIDSDYIYNETIPNIRDIGFFTTSGVESILLNPIYAFGKWYQPNDICVEWHKVFLYSCAIMRKEWNICTIKKIYERFLTFLENNICIMQEAPPIISEEIYYSALLKNIELFQSFLKGEDEPVISKELLQVLKSRYLYLPHVFRMFPMQENKAQGFSNEEINFKIERATKEIDTYEKGVLWEDAVEYYISNIDGLKITAKRIRTGNQEIDISIINTSTNDVLWQMGAYILVECKNHKEHVGIKEIRNIGHVCNMKGCNTALLFVTNGITEDAKREIIRMSSSDLYVVCITKEDLMTLNSNADCFDLLINKFLKLKNLNENLI